MGHDEDAWQRIGEWMGMSMGTFSLEAADQLFLGFDSLDFEGASLRLRAYGSEEIQSRVAMQISTILAQDRDRLDEYTRHFAELGVSQRRIVADAIGEARLVAAIPLLIDAVLNDEYEVALWAAGSAGKMIGDSVDQLREALYSRPDVSRSGLLIDALCKTGDASGRRAAEAFVDESGNEHLRPFLGLN